MKFFVILELILIAACIAVSFFDVIPATVQTALIIACVVVGIIMFVFIGIRIYRDLKK